MTRLARHSTLTIRGADGQIHVGEGAGWSTAVAAVARQHAEAEDRAVVKAITTLGALVLASSELEAIHPTNCTGCRTCRIVLPACRRAVEAASASA